MIKTRFLAGAVTVLGVGLLSLVLGATASAKPILMPTVTKEIQKQKAIWRAHTFAPAGSLQPPAPPCPENGLLPAPFTNCGVPQAPGTTLPYAGNMAYFGGHVHVNPKVYIVYWGWGEPGAFPAGQTCSPQTITEGSISATLACDPDGVGKRTADFTYNMGGSNWAGVQTQYYQTDSAGNKTYINNPTNQLGGIWVDDTNSASGLPKTSGTSPPGATNTYTDLAAEAQRAVAHFGLTDLHDVNIVVAQPPKFSDPNALSTGYCAFHDYTQPKVSGGIYDGIQPGIAYTNFPYVPAINSNGQNVCGTNAVNSGPAGALDGVSIVLGHEIEETVTDPGAETVLGGSGLNNQQFLGGWYDAADANENGDKCAWVGENLLTGQGTVSAVPGAMGNVTFKDGKQYAVQSLWSNQSAAGTGYCAGAGTDLPTG